MILDHASKTYVTYPISEWEQEVSQGMGTGEHVHKREVRVEATGAQRVINGFKTRQIHVYLDDFLYQDSWVTQDVDLQEMLTAVKKGIGQLSGFSDSEMEEKEELYQKVSAWGFPILTNEYRQIGGKILKEMTIVKRIDTQRLKSRLFHPPKGYRKRTP